MYFDRHAGERAPGHLLVQHRLMAEIAAGAAPFLGDVDAEKAEFAGAPPQLVPDMPAPARLPVLRLHLRFDKTHPRIAEALDLRVVPRALELHQHGRGFPSHPYRLSLRAERSNLDGRSALGSRLLRRCAPRNDGDG